MLQNKEDLPPLKGMTTRIVVPRIRFQIEAVDLPIHQARRNFDFFVGGVKGPQGISIQEEEGVRVRDNPQVKGILVPIGYNKPRVEPVTVPGPAVFPGAGYFVPGPGRDIRRPVDTFLRGHGFKIEFFNFPVPFTLQKMKILTYPLFCLWN
jgi:hypothetical protein